MSPSQNGLLFMKMYLPSSFLLRYVIGLRWMCKHLWMNLIKRTIDIQEKKLVKIYIHVCTQSMGSPSCDIHIFWQSYMYIQRRRHTQLCINGLSKSAQTFTVGVCKIAFYSPNPHCWGPPPPPFNTHFYWGREVGVPPPHPPPQMGICMAWVIPYDIHMYCF